MEQFSVLELKEICRKNKISGYSRLNKKDLIDLINSSIHTTKYTFLETCAGAGGLSSGLIKAGFSPLLLNDNNKDCCETLKLNHDTEIICCDMDKLNLQKYENKVDLYVAGLSCQSFSIAGERKGLEDPRGQLIYTFIEHAKILKPKIFMIENVKGLTNHNNGETFKIFLKLLEANSNYTIKYKLLNAYDYEVPQKRERIFIIGIRKDLKKRFEFPIPSTNKKVLKDIKLEESLSISPCVKYSQEKIDLFKLIPQGGCWIDLPEDLQKEYLGNSYKSSGGKRGILKRLSLNEPCLTLLCTPTQKQTERCHPLYERPLSIKESARIQTFDDDYIFYGSITSQYKQIGNAVPVLLSYAIGKELIKLLN